MTSDLDIHRSAQALIQQHGQDAPIHAAMRADTMLDKGDMDGCAVWKRILRAVKELQGTEPRSGDVRRLRTLCDRHGITRKFSRNWRVIIHFT